MKNITPKELKALKDGGKKIKIIDVRSPIEFRMGHIPGAVNIPLPTIAGSMPACSPEEEVVMVCQAGGRSSAACQQVQGSVPCLRNLSGGTSAWIAEGFEVAKQTSEPISVERQTHLVAGSLILAAFVLSALVSPGWIALAGLPMFGLLLHGFTGICPMSLILGRLPMNRCDVKAPA
jgi:rhodanese-related sulfurtransferase